MVLASSRALRRFIVGTDRPPDWFRILSHCFGRTGRLRRTVRNPLRSDRFLSVNTAACHLNAPVGNSGQAFERWSVSLSDGAYPRPEGRGIAPAPPITWETIPAVSADVIPCVGSVRRVQSPSVGWRAVSAATSAAGRTPIPSRRWSPKAGNSLTWARTCDRGRVRRGGRERPGDRRRVLR